MRDKGAGGLALPLLQVFAQNTQPPLGATEEQGGSASITGLAGEFQKTKGAAND